MLSIGEFASIGRVSVRMLRHYDEIGLLRPARVDPYTGYRSYSAPQLTTLSRIVELRGFGLSLEQIRRVLCDDAGDVELEQVLASARDELQRSLADGRARLARLEASLRRTRGEAVMPTPETITVDIRSTEAQRVATITRQAAGFDNQNIGPVVGPIFPDVMDALTRAGVDDSGPAIARYEADESGDGTGALVTAGFVVPASTAELPGVDVSTVPGIAEAAVTVHRGDMTGIDGSWQALAEWIGQNGYEFAGVCTEVYWTPGDRPQSEWVTDLVQPVRRVTEQA